MMRIDLNAPSCLFLGIAPVEGEWCEIGVALTHPPLVMSATPADTFEVSGGRADFTYGHALRHFSARAIQPAGNIEIEFGLHSCMGIGSDAVHTLAVCSITNQLLEMAPLKRAAMAKAIGLPLNSFEWHAFEQGGVVATGQNNVLQWRVELSKTTDDDEDWVWVLVLPRLADNVADDEEMQKREWRWRTRKELPFNDLQTAARLITAGATNRDFEMFCDGLMGLNQTTTRLHTSADSEVIRMFKEGGARAWGKSLSGKGLYGLVKGTRASQMLRDGIMATLGYEGPAVFGALTNNVGAEMKIEQT